MSERSGSLVNQHIKAFMRQKRRTNLQYILALLSACLLGAGLFAAVDAAPRLSVSLVYFRGESLDDAARLEWQTATELNTAGFKIRRANDAGGPFQDLSQIGLLGAQGSASSGHTYEAIDDTADNGNTYWYRLVEIEADNSETDLETIELSIAAEPTSEPIGGGESGATATPIPTSTTAPTNTPQPDATSTSTDAGPSPTATATLQTGATNTPAPTATNDEGAGLDPPPSPTRFTTREATTGAAGPTAIAQATEAPDGYPGVDPENGESPPEGYPAATAGVEEQTTPFESQEGLPGAGSATSDSSVGSGPLSGGRTVGENSETGGIEEANAAESGSLGRILLWIGFAVSLLIFVGGAFFAILLSTRKRDEAA